MQKLRNIFFYLVSLRKINGLFSTTVSLEQKSGFKFERNKDLTFIIISIDIKKNYCDNILGHIALPINK